MSESKYTPGPWRIELSTTYPLGTNGYWYIIANNTILGGNTIIFNGTMANEADMNLIAAAPEMYELLKTLQKGHTYGNATWQNIERVLRKARGEEDK